MSWEERWSNSKRRSYYFNPVSGESSWVPPTAVQAHYDRVTSLSTSREKGGRGSVPGTWPGHGLQQQHEREARRDGTRQARALNNWVKSCLIERYGFRRAVLDLSCGKGGDLQKWRRAGAPRYLGVDISGEAVAEATRRAARVFPAAKIFQGDLSRSPGCDNRLGSDLTFGVVSCMFALHYFWRSERALRQLLSTVRDNLSVGGHFILTVPRAGTLKHYFEEAARQTVRTQATDIFPQADTVVRATNGLFALEMRRDRWEALLDATQPFGWEYAFSLPGCLDECVEYVIFPRVLDELCAEHDLALVSRRSFPDFVAHEAQNELQRMHAMGVLDSGGSIPEDQWEASSLYDAVVYLRRPSKDAGAGAGAAKQPK
jgi:mRNA (guanine-N7-)-methyltransferase